MEGYADVLQIASDRNNTGISTDDTLRSRYALVQFCIDVLQIAAERHNTGDIMDNYLKSHHALAQSCRQGKDINTNMRRVKS